MLPITKWTGSKRYQAPVIVDNFLKNINTYYEPFIGGGSVLCEYLNRIESGNYKCNNIVCCDINKDLIDIYNFIKINPNKFIEEYEILFEQFEPLNDIGRKEFYYHIRDEYNNLKRQGIYNDIRTIYFNWLMRTCFNGLIRYNKYGDFNASCHFTRHGMTPIKMEKLINEWSLLLNKHNVNILNCSYDDLSDFNINDLIYCDPPYATPTGGMYSFEIFDNKKFFEWLKNIPCKYLLSYDGKSGDTDNTYNDMPKEIYDKHIYIDSSLSGFKKLTQNKLENVYDSLYIKEAKE